MAETYKKLYQAQLPNSAGTLFTAGGSASIIVKHIRLTNTTGTDRTATLYHDGTAATNNILPAATIKAGGWAEFDGAILMEASDTIAGEASAASAITCTIYGLEIT